MVYAAILAGGKGTRMGGELPKQFLPIGGTPVMLHTLRRFTESGLVDGMAVCVPQAYMDYTRALIDGQPDLAGRVTVLEGGEDRTGSLTNACRFFAEGREPADDDVLITHDCVRPFVTAEMIADSIAAARQYGGATAAVPCVDTICVSKDGRVIDSVPPRKELYCVQTPQTFLMKDFCTLLDSLTEEEKQHITDASAVLRLRGRAVALSQGSPANIKLTHPDDLALAESLLHTYGK